MQPNLILALLFPVPGGMAKKRAAHTRRGAVRRSVPVKAVAPLAVEGKALKAMTKVKLKPGNTHPLDVLPNVASFDTTSSSSTCL